MAISRTLVLQLLLYLSLFKVCVCFNIDVSKPRVFDGPNKGSLFGYSTLLQRTPSGLQLIVGAPKDNNVKRTGTGATYRCRVNDTRSCTREYIARDPPDESVSGTWYTDGEMYGSFVTQTVNDSLVICAPKFNDLQFENQNFPFLIGRCVINEEFYRPLFEQSIGSYFKEISIGPGISRHIYMGGMGQSGLSGDFLEDGSVLLGTPGFLEWRGGVILMKSLSLSYYETEVFDYFKDEKNSPDFSYMGYSVVSGNFCGTGVVCFATGGPRKKSGKVLILQYTPSLQKVDEHQVFKGDQTGSYFGASLCAADVNGDGADDLLVGAPFFTDEDDDYSKKIHMDEGRVTVYINQAKANRFHFQKSIVLEGSNEERARFGTTITNIGDVNKDGYEDVAIGAPYEDDGHGVVYIYHGGETGLKREVKQRIPGRDVSDAMTSFGWSISKPADVDGNKYPDFSVGGYLSDKVVILRTRPVVSLQVTMGTNPKLIIRDKSLCPRGIESESCFRIKICFRYTGESLPRTLKFNYTMEVDTEPSIAKDQKRVQVNSSQGFTDTVTAVVTANSQTGGCHEHQAMTIDERRNIDPFTVVRLEARYHLQQPADPGSTIQPIRNMEQPDWIVKDIAFQLPCGDDNECWSDLVLEAKTRIINKNDNVIRPNLKKDIVINATESVVLDVAVRNDGEDAYATIIYIRWTGSVRFQTTQDSVQQTIICSEDVVEVDVIVKKIECKVIRPVNSGRKFDLTAIFNANEMSTDIPDVNFSVAIETGSNETNPKNNMANITTRVWIDAQMNIDGKPDPEQTVIAEANRETTIVTLVHEYVITNNGPSFLPSTFVSLKLPYFLKTDKADKTKAEMLVKSGIVTLARDDATTIECLPAPQTEGQNQTTTSVPVTTTSGKGEATTTSSINIKPSKLVDGPQNIIEDGNDKVFIMDCVDYTCEEYQCILHQLQAGGSAFVKVTIEIPADNFRFDVTDNIDYLKYQSTATVKRPTNPLLYPWNAEVAKTISTRIYPEVPPAKVNIWIIIGSVLGGILLLIIIFIVLYKIGFFKRKRKGQVQKWKRESGYYKRNEPRGRKNGAPIDSAIPEEVAINQ